MEYLAHYGVKGMKWGIWNAETSARYRGIRKLSGVEKEQASLARQTARQFKEARKNGDWEGRNVSVTNTVHERLADARKKLNDSDPLGQKYYSDPQLQKKYKEKYAQQLARKYGENTEAYRYGVLYDDLDQGSLSAFSFESSYDLYVKDQVKDPKAYFAKQYDAMEEYRKAVKKEVNNLLGSYSEAYTHKNPNGSLSGKISDEVYYQSLSRANEERSQSRNYYDPWKDKK